MKNKKWAKVTMLAAAFALCGAIAVGVYAFAGATKTINGGTISYTPGSFKGELLSVAAISKIGGETVDNGFELTGSFEDGWEFTGADFSDDDDYIVFTLTINLATNFDTMDYEITLPSSQGFLIVNKISGDLQGTVNSGNTTAVVVVSYSVNSAAKAGTLSNVSISVEFSETAPVAP